MAIQSLWLQDFRCFENLELFFSDGLNWIYGNNGSGKTSLLEAIYWCARARSFRSHQGKTLISENKSQALVRLCLEEQVYLGAILNKKGSNSFRYKGEAIQRTSQLSQYIASQFLGPQSHRLVEPDPEARRLWLDWSLFHVKPFYLSLYLKLKRNLAQRNQALRQKQPTNVVTAFDNSICVLAVQLEAERASFVEALNLSVNTIGEAFENQFPLQLHFKSLVPTNESAYAELLAKYLIKDRERGFTWHSPFRSKFVIESKDQQAAAVLSRGQQKLAAFILLLAQQGLLGQQQQKANVLLVDDLHAELDLHNRHLLAAYLKGTGQQVLVTSTEKPDSQMNIDSLFHVKQGRLVTE